ncbi:unnamed protein product [Strongylus vulgaris]|uniref:Phlebovirus glycoprotein G2 fusion domain-containing protein n=1 Tax=Strongylus vulgaris TaxID=40348 RepID=A0A3P7L6T5_STRVU|nr:unnamed protein product [Strongylus vulgaris]
MYHSTVKSRMLTIKSNPHRSTFIHHRDIALFTTVCANDHWKSHTLDNLGVLWTIIICARMVRSCIKTLLRRTRRLRTRQERMAAIMAIVIIVRCQYDVHICQNNVNVLEHHSTVCKVMEGRVACIFVSETLKINTFKQEACLRITANSSLIANAKIRWFGLYLECERETLYFTRPTANCEDTAI